MVMNVFQQIPTDWQGFKSHYPVRIPSCVFEHCCCCIVDASNFFFNFTETLKRILYKNHGNQFYVYMVTIITIFFYLKANLPSTSIDDIVHDVLGVYMSLITTTRSFLNHFSLMKYLSFEQFLKSCGTQSITIHKGGGG